jgi:hypothetical protein
LIAGLVVIEHLVVVQCVRGVLGVERGESLVLGARHTVLHASAAENGRADHGGEDGRAERRRHQPEAPAELESGRQVGVIVNSELLVLREQHKEPADRVEDQREENGDLGANHKVQGNAVLETRREEGELRDRDEYEREAVEGGAGGEQSGRVGLQTLRTVQVVQVVRVARGPQRDGRLLVFAPNSGGDRDVVEHVRREHKEQHGDEAHFEQGNSEHFAVCLEMCSCQFKKKGLFDWFVGCF